MRFGVLSSSRPHEPTRQDRQPKPMTDQKRSRGPLHVAFVVGATLAALYSVNLSQMHAANRNALGVEADLAAQVANERSIVASLETQTAYAYTDTAAEEYARNEKGWVRPGDHAVVIVPITPVAPARTGTGHAAQKRSWWASIVQWLQGEK